MATPHDTIVAVSSPPGRSLRALVRISGDAATPILSDLIGTTPPERVLTPCRIGALPALVTLFRGPRSYTAQDLVELQCPGNPALLDRLMHRVIALGARLAEPGEYTFRAFIAGKLDLTQAEGVAATIAAVSDSQLQAASMLREGELGRWSAELVDRLASQLALVEAGIDFVDQEDVTPIAPGALDDALASAHDRVTQLLARSRSWGTLEAMPQIVLVGYPSSGKSTLFNALLGRTRAVISPAPGTTRDVLTEPLTLPGPHGRRVEALLVDIAGLDTPTGALDRDVQQAARRAIKQADLVLHVHAADDPRPRLPLPKGTVELRVTTKADCATPTDDALAVSAATGQGLDALRQAMAQRLGERAVSLVSDMLALQPRHEAALRDAQAHLSAARRLLAPQRPRRDIEHVELVAQSIRSALDALAGLGGRMTPDDVLGRIFATFCIGK